MMREDGAVLLKTACEIALRDDRIGSMMQSAIDASERGEIDAAIAAAQAVLAENPRQCDAAIIEGVLLMHEKRRSARALKSFGHALAQDPNNALALWYLAVDSMGRGNLPRAVALLEAAAKTEPPDSFAAVTLSWLLKTLGNEARAAELLAMNLRSPSGPLTCSALAGLMIGPSHTPARPTRRSGEKGMRCLLDLVRRRLAGREYRMPIPAAGAFVCGPDGQVQAAMDGEVCPHLHNPAAEIYQQRFGGRVAGHYADHFFEIFVRPEVEAEFRRVGLTDLLRRRKGTSAPADMIKVPVGVYALGSNAAGPDHPERRVSIPAFYIDRYPVTNRQWREFQPDHAIQKGHEEHPVSNVDFVQATMYVRWRGKRLPSEEEWEAAARGTDGRQFPWGNVADGLAANCADRKRKVTTPVTAHPKGVSPCGAMDMMGNTQEWVDTWATEPAGPQGVRIAKGGAFGLPAERLFCWHRAAIASLTKHPTVGFRCAMDLE